MVNFQLARWSQTWGPLQSLPHGLIHNRDNLFVRQQLIGMRHPAFAKSFMPMRPEADVIGLEKSGVSAA
jgi:hypothetical protein